MSQDFLWLCFVWGGWYFYEMVDSVAIFGAGVSGWAAARLVMARGGRAVVFDERGLGDSDSFSPDELPAFDRFVFSPGFAAAHPWRMLAENSGKPCLSELAFAAGFWKGRILGVTGTNGKTTLTSLVASGLRCAGLDAVEAGNIGVPLSDRVLESGNHESAFAVCEVSSFQAELSSTLMLDALIWTNFAEDHLDRYASTEEYFAAKAKLLDCLKPGVPSVLGEEVAVRLGGERRLPVEVLPPRISIEALADGSPFRHWPQSENFRQAAELWRALNLPDDALIEAANGFQLAAHRLSEVARWGGVSFWNDSKATNFHATLAALASVPGRVYWIGGGASKGGDLAAFARAVAPRIQAAFLYGQIADSLGEQLRCNHSRVEIHSGFDDAVEAATLAALAESEAVVLLSPGFASFDQFSSYAERGKSFIYKVLSLKDTVPHNYSQNQS